MSLEQELEIKVEEVLRSKPAGWGARFLRSRSGTVLIGIISFIEAALPLPLITDPFLIAVILTDRTKAKIVVWVATITSVIGGVVAYFMALFFFEVVLSWLTPGMNAEFSHLVQNQESSTFVLSLIGAVTPVPYTIVAWVVAVLQGSVLAFITASFLGRGFRYVVVGYCTYRFGEQALAYARRYLTLTTVLVLMGAVFFFWYKM